VLRALRSQTRFYYRCRSVLIWSLLGPGCIAAVSGPVYIPAGNIGQTGTEDKGNSCLHARQRMGMCEGICMGEQIGKPTPCLLRPTIGCERTEWERQIHEDSHGTEEDEALPEPQKPDSDSV